ncbi:response regulator transcription factor [Phycisphaeraceae bacterium D3-23]
MRVLVVEDSPKMNAALKRGLEEHGFVVDACDNGHEGEELAAAEPYDAIVLDVMLPGQDGLAVCRNLRRRGVKSPVLMLTALSGTRDKVDGLDAGGDDYLVKPFEFEELAARLRALMRRSTDVDAAVLRRDGLELHLGKRVAARDGQAIKLTQKQFALLEYFMRNPDRVLTRADIGAHVWDMNLDPFSNVIDVYVSALRKKVDKPFGTRLIHTVVGAGYRFGSPMEGGA